MSDSSLRRIALVIAAAIVTGGALRIWSAVAYPMLDIFDSGPIGGAVVGGLLVGVLAWIGFGPMPVLVRVILSWLGAVAGWGLLYGAALVANGLLDRSETRWLSYRVTDHWHGRRSIVTLQRQGTDGPLWLRLPEQRATVHQPVGTAVSVPVRAGALGVAWRPGPVQPEGPRS